MQTQRIIFLFSILLIPQFLIPSASLQRRTQSQVTPLTPHEIMQNNRILGLELFRENTRIELQEVTTTITQITIIQAYSNRALQDLRDDINTLRSSTVHPTTTQTALSHDETESLKRRVQALEDSTIIQEQISLLSTKIAQLAKDIDNISTHIQDMHESRQHLEKRLGYEFFMTEGRLWNLHERVLALEKK